MTSLCLIFVALVTLLSCVQGNHTRSEASYELKTTQREDETGLLSLVQIPVINALLTVSSKLFPIYTYVIRPIVNLKLSAFTLIAKTSTWLYQNYITILIGTALVVGYCVIGGAFTQELEEMDHRLMQAARQLDEGILKYARMIN